MRTTFHGFVATQKLYGRWFGFQRILKRKIAQQITSIWWQIKKVLISEGNDDDDENG